MKFVKVLTRAFDIQLTEEVEKSVLAEQKRISRLLVPFVTSPAQGQTFSGVFFTGDRPSWILSTDKGGPRIFPSGHAVVHSFTACSLWDSKGDFLLYSEEVSNFSDQVRDRALDLTMWQGPSLMEWLPDIRLDGHIPSRSISRPRPYTHIVFDASTSLIVATSSRSSKFASYDEDGNIVWEPDG